MMSNIAKNKHSIRNELRQMVILRDEATCQKCGKEADVISNDRSYCYEKNKNYVDWGRHWELRGSWKFIAFEIDHIIPRDQGGPNIFKNLQLLCRSCNRKKGAKNA